MKTIPRSHAKRITELKATLTECLIYSLAGSFIGAECDAANAWEALGKYQHARLIDNLNGSFRVRVHSNLWYDLRPASDTAERVIARLRDNPAFLADNPHDEGAAAFDFIRNARARNENSTPRGAYESRRASAERVLAAMRAGK